MSKSIQQPISAPTHVLCTDGTEAGATLGYVPIPQMRDVLGGYVLSANAYGAVGNGTTDDSAAFIAAGLEAAASGQEFITAGPATYHCPGLVAADMGDAYIVGDGIQFTASSYVAAFTQNQWLNRVNDTPQAFANGAIAFTVDDAAVPNWTHLFPVTKDLNIPFAVAWPTQWDRPFIRELYRHGWEIQAHGTIHEDFSSLTPEQIHDSCSQQLLDIAAITGETESTTFVYPYHGRTAESDEIIRSYFGHGRGLTTGGLGYGNAYAFPMESGYPWLLSALVVDSHLSSAGMSNHLKRYLRGLARTNGKAMMYMHVSGTQASLEALVGLREMVGYCRELGIAIVQPRQLFPRNEVSVDPYIERDLGDSWTNGGNVTRSDDVAFKGTHSLKFSGNQYWTYGGIGCIQSVPNVAQNGGFAVYNVRYKHYNSADVARYTKESGIFVGIDGRRRKWSSVEAVNLLGGQGLGLYPSRSAPFGEGTIGIANTNGEWVQVERRIAIPPSVDQWELSFGIWYLRATQLPLYIDAIECEFVSTMPSLAYRSTLLGTAERTIHTDIYRAKEDCSALVVPRAAVAGRIYVVPHATVPAAFNVFSTEAADNGVEFDLVITPRQLLGDYTMGEAE